jgi:hypothetical protein
MVRIIRGPDRSPPPSRLIKTFSAPALGPHHVPAKATPPTPSNEVAAKAVRTAKNPPGINDTQQRF